MLKKKVVYTIEKNYSNIRSELLTPSNDNIKFTLLKTSESMSHVYISTKQLVGIIFAGDSIIHHQKWWYAIILECCQSLSINNIWQPTRALMKTIATILSF